MNVEGEHDLHLLLHAVGMVVSEIFIRRVAVTRGFKWGMSTREERKQHECGTCTRRPPTGPWCTSPLLHYIKWPKNNSTGSHHKRQLRKLETKPLVDIKCSQLIMHAANVLEGWAGHPPSRRQSSARRKQGRLAPIGSSSLYRKYISRGVI